MTPSPHWHPTRDVLVRFSDDPSGLDDATAASVEAHLVACADCRQVLAGLADPALAAESWDAVVDRIDRPRTSALERILELLGVRSGPARLVAATPGLQLSGIVAVVGLTAVAVLAARSADAQGPFLLLAPLIPLVSVALTFAAVAEPAGEAGFATPVHGAGLAVRRASAVLTLALVILATGALALPDLGSAPLAWVLPALALGAGALALGSWWRVETALAGLATVWVTGVALVRYVQGFERPLADTAPFTLAGQVVALALAVVAVVVVGKRADRYSTLEART